MTSPLAELARGRWTGLLPQLGVASHFLTGKHGPCPLCGGKDRFRFDNKDVGLWYCTHDGAGDGFSLLMRLHGWNFREAARRVEALIGGVPVVPSCPRPDPGAARMALNSLWKRCQRPIAGDPASRWLLARVGIYKAPDCLRTHIPSVGYPAMVAMVRGPDGKPATLHRTFLTKDGRKAPIEQPRLLMPGVKLPKGSAIRLFPPDDGTLGIAEGIETALAAASLFGVPCWSAINATMLAAWEPPCDVRHVVIFADRDPKYGGQAAAFALAHRLAVTDRTVRVELPDHDGDFNDVLLAGQQQAAE